MKIDLTRITFGDKRVIQGSDRKLLYFGVPIAVQFIMRPEMSVVEMTVAFHTIFGRPWRRTNVEISVAGAMVWTVLSVLAESALAGVTVYE